MLHTGVKVKVTRIKEMVTNETLVCQSNSPCQYPKKCIENSMGNTHTEFQVLRIKNEKQTNKQQQLNKDSVTQSARVNLTQCCCGNEMFNTWIVILASVQSNLKRKKATSAPDFFGSTPVEWESRKIFANKRKQVINYTFFHLYFLTVLHASCIE